MPDTIVVIDDNAMVRHTIRDVLRNEGYRVLEAGDGEEGWRLLSSVDGRCVALIDVIMPDIDGWELMERLRGDERTRRIALIACTAAREGPRGDDIAGRLIKPFDARTLLASVRRALESQPD